MISLCLTAATLLAQAASPPALESEPGPEAVTIAAEAPWITEFREKLALVDQHPRAVGLALAIIDNGEIVFTHVSGETALGSGEPITEDTLFRAASVTKTFTGTLLAMLEADGTVQLDLPTPTSVIDLQGSIQPTWRDLVTHRTGLPPNAYDNLIEAGRPVSMVRNRLADVDLICRVRECYTYQNVAFAAVEDLIEQATGQPFETVAAERLFAPLGLDSAGFGGDHLEGAQSWARPHRGRYSRVGGSTSRYDSLPSAASLSLSLTDMTSWAQALLDSESGIDPVVRQLAFSPYTETRRETRNLRRINRVRESWYGLGWRVYDWSGETTLVGHGGALAGYGAQIILDPETGFGFVALWNADLGLVRMLWPTAVELRYGTGDAPFIDDTLSRMRR